MKLKWGFLLFAMVLVLFVACSDDDDNDNDGPDPNYMASGAIRSNESGVITTESGASIAVPIYAVPLTEDEEIGTIIFSIEEDETANPIAQEGFEKSSTLYHFGPSGFIFNEPVQVTIPIDDYNSDKVYKICRVDDETNEAVPLASIVDHENQTISAKIYHFSPYGVWSSDADETAWGCLHISNNSSSHALSVSVVDFVPAYPIDASVTTCSEFGAYFPSFGSFSSVSSSGNWFLPQGTFTLCFRYSEQGTPMNPPGDPIHWYVYDVVIDEPSTYSSPSISQTFSYSSAAEGAVDGWCDCHPTPTPSAGTGDVQVTLTWHNSDAIDLDLWVTEPSEEMCYYGNEVTATNGTLDRDNLCHNYINGQPENIFWSDAPVGEYLVQVNWFSGCSSSATSQSYDVRIVNGAEVRTFSGSVGVGETDDIASFTVSSNPTLARRNGDSFKYIGTSKICTKDLPAK